MSAVKLHPHDTFDLGHRPKKATTSAKPRRARGVRATAEGVRPLTLEDLLVGVSRETFRSTDEDREWMACAPVGRELL